MDTLTRYIQTGKKLTGLKLFSVFFLLTMLIVGVVGIRLNYALSTPDFQRFLTEFPMIELGDGHVIKPENTVWEKKLANSQFLFQIDTTREKPDNLPENGIVLTPQNVLFILNAQVKQYPLPQEKVVVDTPFLTHLFRMTMINTCVVIGIILLIAFLLGQASTSILTSFGLWFLKREAGKDQIRRSAFIGWLSVLFLNIALRLFGYGFSLIVCVCIAAAISVLGLVLANREN